MSTQSTTTKGATMTATVASRPNDYRYLAHPAVTPKEGT